MEFDKEIRNGSHLERVLNSSVEERPRDESFDEIVGRSACLEQVLCQVKVVAPTDSTVLLTGETGTGKELIARAIHRSSRRSERPFVSVNCAALAPSLVSSELFGHERGAFTGAVQRRAGRFERAHTGTIFLDEIGELSAEAQVALLRVLQEREFERVGGTQSIQVDVRVVAATNRDFRSQIAAGKFRADLFYRLNVFPVELPPLRERKDDIPALVEHFVRVYARRLGKRIPSVENATLELLQAYEWPGNIRELQNVVERSVILTRGNTLSLDNAWLASDSSRLSEPDRSLPSSKASNDEEREIIESALAESRGRVSGAYGAAARLNLPPSTLEHRIRALNISKIQFRYRN